MTIQIKKEKVIEDWHKREVQRKRTVRTVDRILHEATERDYKRIVDMIEREFPTHEIVNSSILEIEKAYPDVANTLRRIARYSINEFNELSEYPDVIFTEFYRRVSDGVVTKNMNFMNGTTRNKTEGFVNNYKGNDDEVYREAISKEYLHDRNVRVNTMSRTTTVQVVTQIVVSMYMNEDFVETKRWNTISPADDRIRPAHRKLDGEVVPADATFSNGLSGPSEYNCRCSLSPGFKEEDDIIQEFEDEVGLEDI